MSLAALGHAAWALILLLVTTLVPGVLFTLGVFPRLPVTQRVALGGALGLALPALVETILGHYFGVRVTFALALGLAFALSAFALLAWPRRHAWREWARPQPGTTRAGTWALLALLLVGGVLIVKPHVDYALPLHRDEWEHYDAAATIHRAGGDVTAVEVIGMFGFARHPELAFHVLLEHAHALTGQPFDTLFLAWPVFVSTLLLVALFAVSAPAGYGHEAVLMGLAIPTSIRVLGPQLVVPLALGLFLIPVCYLLFLRPERVRAWTLLAALMAFVYLAHPPSAVAVAFLMLGYGVASSRRAWRFTLALLPLAAAPFLLAKLEAPAGLTSLDTVFAQRIVLPVPTFLDLFGYLPAALFLVGTFVALRTLEPRRIGWLVTSLAHLAIIVVYLQFHVGVNILYDRAWMHGLLTMSMTAAAGLAFLRREALARFPPSRAWARPALAALLALAVLAPAATAQDAREKDQYRFITPEEAEDFRWMGENLDLNASERVAIDTRKGVALHALSGLHPVVRSWSEEPTPWLARFLDEERADNATTVKRYHIAAVYSHAGARGSLFEPTERPAVFVRSPS